MTEVDDINTTISKKHSLAFSEVVLITKSQNHQFFYIFRKSKPLKQFGQTTYFSFGIYFLTLHEGKIYIEENNRQFDY